jgi:hypothetical protein
MLALFRWTEVQLPLLKQGAPSWCPGSVSARLQIVLLWPIFGTVETVP